MKPSFWCSRLLFFRLSTQVPLKSGFWANAFEPPVVSNSITKQAYSVLVIKWNGCLKKDCYVAPFPNAARLCFDAMKLPVHHQFLRYLLFVRRFNFEKMNAVKNA